MCWHCFSAYSLISVENMWKLNCTYAYAFIDIFRHLVEHMTWESNLNLLVLLQTMTTVYIWHRGKLIFQLTISFKIYILELYLSLVDLYFDLLHKFYRSNVTAAINATASPSKSSSSVEKVSTWIPGCLLMAILPFL